MHTQVQTLSHASFHLLFLSAILVAWFPLSAAAASAGQHSRCKSTPGSPSWPSPDVWSSLNESTGGRLFQPAPPGAVCHPEQPTYDAARCPGVAADWSTYDFHQADPVSSMWNQFNNDTCLPNASYPCSGQGYPLFVINATTVKHVKLGVDFARKHNIRLIVKSTGHDYLGRSSAPNSLSIWTHYMKGMTVHGDSFSPSCCGVKIDGGAVTVGAGQQMGELYEALDKYNRTIVGGGGATVSVGGYLTGGGHSVLAPRHGLATDQVLQMEVVTTKGEIMTINECKSPDLFWAMRGGGGSTFAIMTSVTFKTFPTPKMVSLDFVIATLASLPSAAYAYDMIAYLLAQLPALGDAGVSGYHFMFDAYPNPTDGGATIISGVLGSVALQDSDRVADILALYAPIFAHMAVAFPGFAVVPTPAAYPSFWAYYQPHADSFAAGENHYTCSRLLDAPALTAGRATREAVRALVGQGGVGGAYLVSGRGVWGARPRGGGNAVLPAWRRAYVHATCGAEFRPLNSTSKESAFAEMDQRLGKLRALAPDMGAYMNEADPREPDWKHQFWGENYPRLAAIKKAVDPDDVLWCNPCVGNDGWEEVGDMLCRV